MSSITERRSWRTRLLSVLDCGGDRDPPQRVLRYRRRGRL